MADQPVTREKLINADKDVQVIEDFIKKSKDETVTTRFGDEIMTLKGLEEEVKKSGGYFKRYTSLAAANADIANIPVNGVVKVTDAVDGGDYERATAEATTLTKSAYDSLVQAKHYADEVNAQLREYEEIQQPGGKNLFNLKEDVRWGYYINTSGVISTAAGWACSTHIPVIAGETYTLSGTFGYRWIGFYNSDTSTTAISHFQPPSSTNTFTVPADATHVVFNLAQASNQNFSNVQLEKNVARTEYEAGYPERKVKAEDVIDLDDTINNAVDAVKDYEIVKPSSGKNLFNAKDGVKYGEYLNVTTGIINITPDTSFASSAHIPVTAGQTYTLSGTFGLKGISFFDSGTSISPVQFVASPTAPYTFTVPAGATHVVFNLAQASNPNFSNVQLELGSQATSYEKGFDERLVSASYVEGLSYIAAATAILNGDNLEINTGNIRQLSRLKRPFSFLNSQAFNFTGAYINGVQVADATDDVPPMYVIGREIAGNHGYLGASVTASGHGKTVADIGSLWQDANNIEYIILDIQDANTILMAKTASNSAFDISTLVFTHKADAANTATINATYIGNRQIYPTTTRHKISLSADNNPVLYQNFNIGFDDNFTISESYSVVAREDIISYVRSQLGNKITSYDSIEPFAVLNNVYKYDTEGGCTITTDFVPLQTISVARLIMNQAGKILGNNLTYYIPKTLPFSQDAISYDFTKGVDINGTQKPTQNLYLEGEYRDPTKNTPDRNIMRSSIGGFGMGILPILDGEQTRRLDLTNRAFGLISTAVKLYCYIADSTLLSSMTTGDALTAKGFRKYFSNTDADKIGEYAVYDADGDYYFIDYKPSVAKVDVIDLPVKLQNRSFEIHEKTANVSVVSKAATSQIAVNITNSADSSYLVLKFSK